jgi:hypothetical protein
VRGTDVHCLSCHAGGGVGTPGERTPPCALHVRSMCAPSALHLRSMCAPAGRHVRSRSLAHPHLPAELRLSWHRLLGPQHVRGSRHTPAWTGPTVLCGAVAHCCTAAATYQQKVRRLTFSMTSVCVPVACFSLRDGCSLNSQARASVHRGCTGPLRSTLGAQAACVMKLAARVM